MVKRVYESENYYHMVLKNNTSSTKAGTTIDENGESDDQNVKNEEFKLKKVDHYLEQKQKENSADDGCENLFKLLNINNEKDESDEQ